MLRKAAVRQRSRMTPEPPLATQLDDRYEDVDEIVTAVILKRRSRSIRVGPLREALRSRTNLLIDSRRLALETYARVPPTRERAVLRAKRGRIIARANDSADAVGSRHWIERPVELAPAQPDRSFERSPSLLNLRQLVCDSHEHDLDRLTHNDVFGGHVSYGTTVASAYVRETRLGPAFGNVIRGLCEASIGSTALYAPIDEGPLRRDMPTRSCWVLFGWSREAHS